MQITVLDGYTLNPGDNPWTGVAALGELTVHDRTPAEEILRRAASAEVLLTNKTLLTAPTLAALPKLRFVSVLATGYNVVDVAAARERGIPVSNVPEYGTNSVAQFVFALLLAGCHHVERHDQLVHQGEGQKRGDFCFWDNPLVELAGKKMGVVGFGRIGRRVGQLANAFGMEVLAHDVQPGAAPAYAPFAWKSIEEVFAQADVVSLHCPQTEQNVGMVNRKLLATMKPTARLINTARGGLVNERDLAEALNAGTLASAALDVLGNEPVAANNPLLTAKNCLLTPHIAWATLEARRRLMGVTADNIAAFQKGNPINVVNRSTQR
jgi:glycerate dehydrogenase